MKTNWTGLGLVVLMLVGPAVGAAEPGSLPSSAELTRHDLDRPWHTLLPMMKLRERLRGLHLIEVPLEKAEGQEPKSDLVLFAQTNFGEIHCLDAETGQRRWSTTVATEGTEVFPPAVVGERVYVAAGNTLLELERHTGRILWAKQLPTGASAGPAANAAYIYVPTVDRRLYAFEATEASAGQGSPYRRNPIGWFYYTAAAIDHPPVLSGGLVAVVASDGILYALAEDSRRIRYRYFTHSRVAAPLAVLDKYLYVATNDFDLFAIDTVTGMTKWRFLSGQPILAQPGAYLAAEPMAAETEPAVTGVAPPPAGDVFLTPQDAGLYCLDNRTGQPRWTNRAVTRLVGASRARVYGKDSRGQLVIVTRKDGQTVAAVPMGMFSITAPNPLTDRLCLATPEGLLICLRERASQQPFHHPQQPLPPKEPGAEPVVEPGKEPAAPRRPSGTFFEGESKPPEKPAPAEKPPAKKSGGFFDN